jgi:Protein of unknown function (DUF3631)/Toprim domain
MPASTNTLSPENEERLDTFAVEIAEERFGPFEEEGEGDWRLASNRSILIHPGATVFNFATQSCSHGVLDMLQREAGMTPADAMKFSRKWLAEHAGEGRLAPDDLNEELAERREREDARRTAEIQTMVARRLSHKGTPADVYLASRHLQADDSFVGWVEPTWPGGYGKMITWATGARGEVLAFQSTRLMPDGSKALVKYVRTTHRGPHNWKSRAILRPNCDDGPIDTVHLVEGFEDGLSLVMAGVRNVWVLWGIGRLRRLERDLFPLGLKTIVVVRDDDGDNPDPSAEHSLYRGVAHLEGFGKEVKVTPRPRMVTGAQSSAKDVNDLLCQGGVELVQALMKAKPVGKEDLTGADREEIFDQASRMGRDEYDQGREAIAKRLDVRVGTLDEERKARQDKRMAEAGRNGAPLPDDYEVRLIPHADPVLDFGAVLDEAGGILKQIIAAPDTYFDAAVLWAFHTHLLLRRELRTRHTPRLMFQAPLEDAGKTTFMMLLIYLVARGVATSSLSGASLYRDTDAYHWTILWDEIDNVFHKNVNPELIGIFNAGHDRRGARVRRQASMPDGRIEGETFDTFTGVAGTMIGAFPQRSTQGRCIVLPMKRASPGESAKLVEQDEAHEAALTVCGCKFARFAIDIESLPEVARPPGMINRFWNNWKVLFQIAALAGGPWPARVLAAAEADRTRVMGEKDTHPTYALLDAIWRVLATEAVVMKATAKAGAKPAQCRMLTRDLLPKLFVEDEGRWRTANKGKEIDDYYLRDRLRPFLPDKGPWATDKSHRWRASNNPKEGSLRGYHELHLADAFFRYLDKGLPSLGPPPSTLTADDDDPADAQSGHTPPKGAQSPLSSDSSDPSSKTADETSTYRGSDKHLDPTHGPDQTTHHPTHVDSGSDQGPVDPTHGSDVKGISDPEIDEPHQHVKPNGSDGSDKSVPKGGPAGGILPKVAPFPQTPNGRKARKEL